MTGLPILIDASALDVLVVGGGSVAERKVRALLDSGARVRVVAPRTSDGLRELARTHPSLALDERPYAAGDVGNATLVVAATDDRRVNRAVAADARALRRLAVVADAPREGTCTMMAVHRSGALTIAVSSGGVPRAAAHIRDALARRFDARYAGALRALGALRERLLAEGAAERWREAGRALIGADFCAAVEAGDYAERVAAWR